jgi:hypothetical protein
MNVQVITITSSSLPSKLFSPHSHIKMKKLFSNRAKELLLKISNGVRGQQQQREKKYDENVCLKDGKKERKILR